MGHGAWGMGPKALGIRSHLSHSPPLPSSFYQLYQFRLHRNDLTAENAENAEGAQREMNNSDEERI